MSKDLISIELVTPDRTLNITSPEHIDYGEVRKILSEFVYHNLDFSEYPKDITFFFRFKYKE